MGAIFYPADNPITAREIPTRRKLSQATVEFGTPTRDGRCVNIGICRVTADELSATKIKGRNCRFAKALLQIDQTASMLRCFFPVDGMLPCTERAIFRTGRFPVPQNFILPAELGLHPEGRALLIIPAGIYSIGRLATGYQIEFPLH